VSVGVSVGVLVGVGVGVQIGCAPQLMSACDDATMTSVPPGAMRWSALTVTTHELPPPELVCSLMINTAPLVSVIV
jgi:hypothetical protein